MLKKFIFSIFVCISSACLYSQSNPTSNSIPYFQAFDSLTHASTSFPMGWQGWQTGSGSTAVVNSVTAGADLSLMSNSTSSTTAGGVHNFNGKIGLLQTSSINPSICLAVTTIGKNNITVRYDVMTIRNPYNGTSNTRINEVVLQYRVNLTDTFTTLTGTEYANDSTPYFGNSSTIPQNMTFRNIQLPQICNNKSVIQLRWIARNAQGGGSRPSFAVDNITVFDCSMAVDLSLKHCKHDSLLPVITGGAMPYSFLWSDISTVSYKTPLLSTTYSVTVTDSFGCSASDTVSVLLKDVEFTSLSNTHKLICKDGSLPLYANLMEVYKPVTFNWYRNDTLIFTDSAIVATDSGKYHYTSQNECGVKKSPSIHLKHYPERATLLVSDSLFCKEKTFKDRDFIFLRDADYWKYGKGEWYKWYRKNPATKKYELIAKGYDKHRIRVKRYGRYYFRVFNNECGNSIPSYSFRINQVICQQGIIIDEELFDFEQDEEAIEASEYDEVLVEIEENPDFGYSFSVFPNPVTDKIVINNDSFDDEISLKLVDVLGREMLSKEKITSSQTELNIRHFNSGIYFVELYNRMGTLLYRNKFIKN